ncbi:MAG: thermonuclease family protein [Rhodospirillales bacterium]
MRGPAVPSVLAVVLAVALTLGPARPPPPATADPGQAAIVVAVEDGDTLELDRALEGVRRVRLAGVEAPKPPLGWPPVRPWRAAEAARAALEELAVGRTVTAVAAAAPIDRHGRLLAQLHRDDGVWVQGELLRRGMVRVRTGIDTRARAAEMLALEGEARAAGRGLWSDPFYAVRTPVAAHAAIGSFQIVEGRVVRATRVRNRVYLNFGPDWRTDFTVAVPTRLLRAFEAAGLRPLALADHTVRVRGWLEAVNGPLIEVTHPEQIEVVDAPP